MSQNNYLQTDGYHCKICHKTSTPTETCAHMTTTGADIPTTPCSPACGEFYKPPVLPQEESHDFRFSHYEDIVYPGTTGGINKQAVMVCRHCGLLVKQNVI